MTTVAYDCNQKCMQQGNPVVFCRYSDLEIKAFKVYCNQEEKGWKHFLLDNISQKWKETIPDHYAYLDSKSEDKTPISQSMDQEAPLPYTSYQSSQMAAAQQIPSSNERISS